MTTSNGRILSEIEDDKLKEAVAKGQVRLKADPDENKTDVGSADSYPDGEKPHTNSSGKDQPQDSDTDQPDEKLTEIKVDKI
jgi:hypothetical protein